MALLTIGTPLTWSEAKKYADLIRSLGISQFISSYQRLRERPRDQLLWGDEVEYMLVYFERKSAKVYLSLRAEKVLAQLNKEKSDVGIWNPEYAKYMIEGTPAIPYGSSLEDLLNVEPSMKLRRQVASALLQEGECLLTIVSFPLLGSTHEPFLYPPNASAELNGPAARSQFVPDTVINSHPRFATLTRNIRMRRGKKMAISVPIYKDKNTPSPFIDPGIHSVLCTTKDEYLVDHVYMDAMVFGMGSCCLQATFQALDLDHACHLYDQLAIMAPIMLALTAASPIRKGFLVDIDVRWSTVAASVDDRTQEELGAKPLESSKYVIPKSRYDSIDCFISSRPAHKAEYDDLDVVYDMAIFEHLTEQGKVDSALARHLAHLFIRDPLVVYSESLANGQGKDASSMEHFENIQSTNWNTVRFKPPPPDSTIGWRVEFRPMEVQLTDFENAAFTIFITLLVRTIVTSKLNLYVPLSIVDKNIKAAHQRNAVTEQTFYFRDNVFDEAAPHIRAFTIAQLLNGQNEFPGLIAIVMDHIDTLEVEEPTLSTIKTYLDFVRERASGRLMTTARWIREFVASHPDYAFDSIITSKIQYDLLATFRDISNGSLKKPELLGHFV